jgi:hypothetical protein
MLSEQGNSNLSVGNINTLKLEESNPVGRKSGYTKTESATVAFPSYHIYFTSLYIGTLVRLHIDVSTLECKQH